jgi:hypothetical protein
MFCFVLFFTCFVFIAVFALNGAHFAGTDPYPIGIGDGVNASLARDYAEYTVDGAAGARPVWQVCTLFTLIRA